MSEAHPATEPRECRLPRGQQGSDVGAQFDLGQGGGSTTVSGRRSHRAPCSRLYPNHLRGHDRHKARGGVGGERLDGQGSQRDPAAGSADLDQRPIRSWYVDPHADQVLTKRSDRGSAELEFAPEFDGQEASHATQPKALGSRPRQGDPHLGLLAELARSNGAGDSLRLAPLSQQDESDDKTRDTGPQAATSGASRPKRE